MRNTDFLGHCLITESWGGRNEELWRQFQKEQERGKWLMVKEISFEVHEDVLAGTGWTCRVCSQTRMRAGGLCSTSCDEGKECPCHRHRLNCPSLRKVLYSYGGGTILSDTTFHPYNVCLLFAVASENKYTQIHRLSYISRVFYLH